MITEQLFQAMNRQTYDVKNLAKPNKHLTNNI